MKKLLLLLTLAVWLIGCTKYEELPVDAPESRVVKTRSAIVSADNPYSLANVQKAMDEVCDEMALERIALEPTHYYVRFLPKDTLEYDRLLDRDLMLFTYPLDRELTDEEVAFYSQDTTDTYGYPWQYTKVPTDYVFPEGIIHEILDEVVVETFRPGDINAGVSNFINKEVWDKTLKKTMKVTEEYAARGGYEWRPYAKVTYVDDFNNTVIPLVGVRIRCSRGLHFDRAYTDHNGEAKEFGTFINPARYEIIWNDSYWNIINGIGGQATFTGPHKTGSWEVNIAGDTPEAMQAAIHRGCRAIFYDNPFGITNPEGRINIHAHYNEAGSVNGNFKSSRIRIYRMADGRLRTRWQMTSTSCHELGHASHRRAVIKMPGSNRLEDYEFAEGRLVESWATGIQFAFMNWMYPNQEIKIRRVYSSDYTGVTEWLLNQGLTLKQIEQTVVGERYWYGWRRNVKALGTIDDVIVDMLFDHPFHLNAANFKDLIRGTSQIYTGMDITYSLPPIDNLHRDIIITDWTISGDGCTILDDDRYARSIKLRFNTIGQKTLTAKIRLLGGTIYEVHKNINVTGRGTISGPDAPRTGVQTTYTLTNYAGTVDRWGFTGITKSNYWVVSSTNNSITVVFKNPCTTTVTALVQDNELATKTVTVPNDSSITSFLAYQNQTWPSDIWLMKHTSGTPPATYTYSGQRRMEPSSSKRHFMAYATRPSLLHPYYGLLKPIYENGCYHGKYCYDQRVYPDFPQYGIKAWVFTKQLPGTVPLYLVEFSEYRDETMVTRVAYLTSETLGSWRNVTSWYWNWLGTSKVRDRDWTEQQVWGIMGYAYPYIP